MMCAGTDSKRHEGPPPNAEPRKLVIRGQRASGCNQLLARRGGVNLQQEVEPQRTERPPRDTLLQGTPAKGLVA